MDEWMSNHIANNVCDEITSILPNFNYTAIKVWEWRSNFMPHFIRDLTT